MCFSSIETCAIIAYLAERCVLTETFVTHVVHYNAVDTQRHNATLVRDGMCFCFSFAVHDSRRDAKYCSYATAEHYRVLVHSTVDLSRPRNHRPQPTLKQSIRDIGGTAGMAVRIFSLCTKFFSRAHITYHIVKDTQYIQRTCTSTVPRSGESISIIIGRQKR